MDIQEKREIFDKLQCALTHDMAVCDRCQKCEGENFVEIRFLLVEKLKKLLYN